MGAPAMDPKMFRDFVYFSQRQYDCLDYDPFHPMLYRMSQGMDEESALWLSTLYMAFYNIGSAWVAFCNSDPESGELPEWAYQLPIGVQRRNLRGGLVRKHLEDFHAKATAAGSIKKFLTRGFGTAPGDNWRRLQETLMSVWGNGRWGCYTLGELYQKVNKLPVLPTDIMNDGSSGPRSGLSRLLGVSRDLSVEALDALADGLFVKVKSAIRTRIPYLPAGHYDFGMLESQLCDFNSLCKGNYYIGRDIDRDQERIHATETVLRSMPVKVRYSALSTLNECWEVRSQVFERHYLGEYQGRWNGRTEYANKLYLRTGKVGDHVEAFAEHRKGLLF